MKMCKIFASLCALLLLIPAGYSKESNEADMALEADAIYRISEVTVASDCIDSYLGFAREVAEASVNVEPGVIAIFPMQDKNDTAHIRIIEIYVSESAYRAHLESSHFKRYKKGTMNMVKELKLIDHRPVVPELVPNVFRKAETESSKRH